MTFSTRDNVTSLEQKRRERAGFEKLAVLETPDADLLAERDRVDSAWKRVSGKRHEPARDLTPNINRLAAALETVQTELARIAVAVEPDPLPGAVVGLMGNNAEEVRTQLQPLREALKDDDGGDAA